MKVDAFLNNQWRSVRKSLVINILLLLASMLVAHASLYFSGFYSSPDWSIYHWFLMTTMIFSGPWYVLITFMMSDELYLNILSIIFFII